MGGRVNRVGADPPAADQDQVHPVPLQAFPGVWMGRSSAPLGATMWSAPARKPPSRSTNRVSGQRALIAAMCARAASRPPIRSPAVTFSNTKSGATTGDDGVHDLRAAPPAPPGSCYLCIKKRVAGVSRSACPPTFDPAARAHPESGSAEVGAAGVSANTATSRSALASTPPKLRQSVAHDVQRHKNDGHDDDEGKHLPASKPRHGTGDRAVRVRRGGAGIGPRSAIVA